MARPRVFLSSTFYDLKHVRADLDRFITSLGYDSVLNEHGSIPYGKDDALETYCYREISNVDILVAVVGGRLGVASHSGHYSISQQEIKTALQHEKPVFIFVERGVHAEYDTYKRNKDNLSITYASVDDKKIFVFLDEIYALPNNNPVFAFENSRDITDYLREQWAGLFQRALAEQTRLKELNLVARMETTATTLNQLVQFLTEERKDKDQAIRDILLTTHPIFEQLRELTKTTYRIFFDSMTEMEIWLKARNFLPYSEAAWDDENHREWYTVTGKGSAKEKTVFLHIFNGVFDDEGRLRVFTSYEWNSAWVYITSHDVQKIDDDDIPF